MPAGQDSNQRRGRRSKRGGRGRSATPASKAVGKPMAGRDMTGRNKPYPPVKARKNHGAITRATHPCSGDCFQGEPRATLFGR
jgi:hypothetical protein